MWMVLGPLVAKRGMNNFMSEAYDLTDEELSDPKKMMHAIAKKQGQVFADSIHGALGNIMQTVPTEELAKLAGQHPELAQQFLGGGGAQNIMQALGMGGGSENGGGKNPFAGIVQMMLAMQAMQAMGGGGGGGGVPMLGGFGGGGGSFHPGIRR